MNLFSHPPLTLALAMGAGVLVQALARHTRVPGIVLLLIAGALLGPDGANVIRPSILGAALPAIVGFGVAVILFEGGLRLELRVLRKQAVPIRRLVTVGILISAIGGAVACRLAMGWSWQLCVLFGTIVVVTGPTVVTPMVRRIGLHKDIGTILEAEGVFIDAIGATIAVVALEFVVATSGGAVEDAALSIALRFGVGGAVGIAGGLLLALMLRWRNVVPSGLENVLTLSFAIVTFELSNAIVAESGIAAAVVAGMILGNMRSYALSDIAEFKEQLTMLLVATLFLLLSADVRLGDVTDLGVAGVITVAALMFLVRPATVFISTVRTGLSLREKLFLAWCAPRGIVAAAVASLFALELSHAGIEGGEALRTLVFMVIALTVTIQGLSGGVVAGWLGVRSPRDIGYLVLGASPMALHIAQRLADSGQAIVIIDSNADASEAARTAGFEVLSGNGLGARTLAAANPELRRGCIAITRNESVNLIFARRVREDFDGPVVHVAIDTDNPGVTAGMIKRIDARVLFGGIRGLHRWVRLWERGQITLARCELHADTPQDEALVSRDASRVLLPLFKERDGALELIDQTTKLRRGDIVEFAFDSSRSVEAIAWLDANHWRPLGSGPEVSGSEVSGSEAGGPQE